MEYRIVWNFDIDDLELESSEDGVIWEIADNPQKKKEMIDFIKECADARPNPDIY